MQDREYSSDPKIREVAHFEGHLSAFEFNHAISYAIDEADVISYYIFFLRILFIFIYYIFFQVTSMKSIGYRIFEFGKFNWNKIISALNIYNAHFGDVNVPFDFVVDETIIDSGIGFDETFEDLNLGEAVQSIRIGDVDGLEDPQRRKILADLHFEWGDDKYYQRYRFVPMLIGLRLYKHLYGFAMPQSDFRVPDEPQWPYWMVNMPLGVSR